MDHRSQSVAARAFSSKDLDSNANTLGSDILLTASTFRIDRSKVLLAEDGPAVVLARVEQGALPDLLLLDADPLSDIKLIADSENTLKVIIKDGTVVKNTL